MYLFQTLYLVYRHMTNPPAM